MALVASATLQLKDPLLRADDWIFGASSDPMLMASLPANVVAQKKPQRLVHVLRQARQTQQDDEGRGSRHVVLVAAFVIGSLWSAATVYYK